MKLKDLENPETLVPLIPLGFGVTSVVTLTVAMVTDHWVVTWDEGPDSKKVYETLTKTHFGLWRACTMHYLTDTTYCTLMDFSPEGNPSTAHQLFYSMSRPLVACVLSLSLLVSAVIWSTVDIHRKGRTVGGTVLYAFGVLSLGAGCIAFISAINDATSARSHEDEMFFNHFGWDYAYEWSSLYLLPVTLASACLALISNAMIYARRYHNLNKRSMIRIQDLAPLPNK